MLQGEPVAGPRKTCSKEGIPLQGFTVGTIFKLEPLGGEPVVTETLRVRIAVVSESVAASSRQAQALERLIQQEVPRSEVERIRDSTETLDGGATLAVALASPVLLELARALRVFLQRHNSSRISITDEHDTISATDVSFDTIDDVIQAWNSRSNAR